MNQFEFGREVFVNIDTGTAKKMQLFKELHKIGAAFMKNDGFWD